MLYAYNPPGVGEEAAEVKAQVKHKTLHYLIPQTSLCTQQAERASGCGDAAAPPYADGDPWPIPLASRHTPCNAPGVSRGCAAIAFFTRW